MATNKELEQLVKQLEKNVIDIAQALKDLSEDVKKAKPTEPVKIENKVEPIEGNNKFPIPTEYRQLVNNILNKAFGIELDYTAAGFAFTVLVPLKYTPLTKNELDQVKMDRRTKIIPNYEGTDGVRRWVELIYSSFSSEMKSIITQDR